MEFEHDIKVLRNGDIFIAWGLKYLRTDFHHILKGKILNKWGYIIKDEFIINSFHNKTVIST